MRSVIQCPFGADGVAGNVVMVSAGVGTFNLNLRFRTGLSSEVGEQLAQFDITHHKCLVQVRENSCIGVSGVSRIWLLEPWTDWLADIV